MTVACGNIEKITLDNTDYRRVLHTTDTMQLVVMSLEPGEFIHAETHPGTTQFFRIEAGTALFRVGERTFTGNPGDFITVPPGARHEVSNASGIDTLKLYTLYSPPEHHRTRVNKRMPRKQ